MSFERERRTVPGPVPGQNALPPPGTSGASVSDGGAVRVLPRPGPPFGSARLPLRLPLRPGLCVSFGTVLTSPECFSASLGWMTRFSFLARLMWRATWADLGCKTARPGVCGAGAGVGFAGRCVRVRETPALGSPRGRCPGRLGTRVPLAHSCPPKTLACAGCRFRLTHLEPSGGPRQGSKGSLCGGEAIKIPDLIYFISIRPFEFLKFLLVSPFIHCVFKTLI